MSKKQVIVLSAIPGLAAALLLYFLVMNGLDHGGQMFSGMMTVLVGLTGLLCLFGLVGLPFYVMAFYPAEGFTAMMPPSVANQSPAAKPGADEDEFEDDDLSGFSDDEEFEDDDDFGSDDSFADDGFDDDGFEDDEYEDDEWK